MRLSLPIAVFSLFFASSAGATPFLAADTSTSPFAGGCTLTGGLATSTGAAVSSHLACISSFGAGSSVALTSTGNLGAAATAGGSSSGIGFSGLSVYKNTVTFSGPGGGTIPVGINLHLSGTQDAVGGAEATLIARALLNGVIVGSIGLRNTSGTPSCVIGDALSIAMFTGLGACDSDYNATLASGLTLVPLNIPIPFQLDLSAMAVAIDFTGFTRSLFDTTFGFVTGGPLFNLPAGFTANSPTSFIFNNQFFPSGQPPANVPEPSSMLLISSALGLFAMSRRRRTGAGKQNS